MNSNGQAPAGSLNEYQANRLRVTCQYIDNLLSDVEAVLHTLESNAAFPRYAADVARAQRAVIEDYTARLRAQLLTVLDRQGISVPKPSIPASRAIGAIIDAIDIAVEELNPQYMHGYGPLSESAAAELGGIVAELAGLVFCLARHFARREAQEPSACERPEKAGNDQHKGGGKGLLL